MRNAKRSKTCSNAMLRIDDMFCDDICDDNAVVTLALPNPEYVQDFVSEVMGEMALQIRTGLLPGYKFEINTFNATAVEQKVPVRFPRIICPEVEGETNASSPTETSPNATRVETGFFDEEYVNGQSDSALSPQYATKVAASAVKAVLPLLESDPEVTRRPPRPYTPGSLHESPPDQALPKRVKTKICVKNVMQWDVDPRYIFFNLKRKGVQAHREGDNIAIKGSSPQHVVDTFCAFGLQIQEAETNTETETYMDTTSQKIVAVVETQTTHCVLMHMLEWIGCTIMQWKKYRAIMWQLKLLGTKRGWQGVSEPSVLNSKSKDLGITHTPDVKVLIRGLASTTVFRLIDGNMTCGKLKSELV